MISTQKFAQRSYEPELLDRDEIEKESLFQNLRELDLINRYLGGHAITIAGVEPFIKDSSKTYHLLDVGCGGGDTLIALAAWGRKKGYRLQLTGVDLKSDVIGYAAAKCAAWPEISFLQSDYRDIGQTSAAPVDVFITSLFCHHLDDEQLIGFLSFLYRNAQLGFVINDLQRHPLAYYSIYGLTRIFNGSELVKNDAPLSVLRGFSKAELVSFLQKAGVDHFMVEWKWAFRYLVRGEIIRNYELRGGHK